MLITERGLQVLEQASVLAEQIGTAVMTEKERLAMVQDDYPDTSGYVVRAVTAAGSQAGGHGANRARCPLGPTRVVPGLHWP